MSQPMTFRHVVSIAGMVREEPVPAAGDENNNGNHNGRQRARPPLRIANALVEIIVDEAPQAFQTMVAARRADPAWRQRRTRLDRTWSEADGIFYFLDLPPSAADGHYRLRISVPHMGTRYGVVETEPLQVQENPAGPPGQVAWTEVELTPTRVHGTVKRLNADDTTQPLAGASVRLRGDTKMVRTKADGSYQLAPLVAGQPTLEVSAPSFETYTETLELAAGHDLEVNVWLAPVGTREAGPQAAERVADDLTQVNGIGPTYHQRLRRGGIHTFAQLADASVAQLEEIIGPQPWQNVDLASWIEQAQALAGGR